MEVQFYERNAFAKSLYTVSFNWLKLAITSKIGDKMKNLPVNGTFLNSV